MYIDQDFQDNVHNAGLQSCQGSKYIVRTQSRQHLLQIVQVNVTLKLQAIPIF